MLVTDEELSALAPDESRDIDLTRFVQRSELPPMYFERAYFLVPSGGSTLAYRLLASTMEHSKRAGIATFVMRGKQYVVAIVAERGILRAETLRFADELRSPEDVGLPQPAEPDESEVKRMRAAIKAHTKDSFPRALLQDAYWQRLTELVAEKEKRGEGIVEPEVAAEPAGAQVIDLVAMLKRSLEGQANENGKKKAAPRARSAHRERTPEKPAKRSAPRTGRSATKRPAAKRASSRTARARA